MNSAGLERTPLSVLRGTFGYPSFLSCQAAVVNCLCSGRDALVVMPTGGGKSVCFQIPALIRPGVAVVISPLIALMEDQVTALVQNGVRAACLNSSLPAEEISRVEQCLLNAELDLLYIAPERLLTPYSLNLFSRVQLALFAIDEAHCVSQWGHDFRRDYLQLSILKDRFRAVPRVALTATANQATRDEIASRLELVDPEIFVSGFDRPNIRYRVSRKENAKKRLLDFMNLVHPGESGIIYCLSRKRVEAIATWLRQSDINAYPYHAGLSADTRRQNQKRFIMNEGVVMVATVAFGMGIDKPNVRFVVHLDPPRSIEAYYQETGRAGRDGLPADAWMFLGLQDVFRLRQMIEGSESVNARKRVEHEKLNHILEFCDATGCRRTVLLNYFEENHIHPCGNCDNCMDPPETWDATEESRMALSCVYRTGQRFGVSHVVDVLMGKTSDRMRSLGHDRLSTWGIGKQLSQIEWRSLFRQLVLRGMLEIGYDQFGALRLVRASRPLLKGECRLIVRKEKKTAEKRRLKYNELEFNGDEQLLWNRLRDERARIAREQAIPPYMIFHDSTLQQMVAHKPRSRAEMAVLSGVGERKLVRYGNRFIKIVQVFADSTGQNGSLK
ncbi:MAG: DNA helicase RecQ [Pseudomonadota bacterium]|nr:DNA helicase RecQ [Pseudomonadota bacterium]